MNRLIRYFNQNREKIIITVAIVAFILIIIQVVNNIIASNNLKKQNSENNNQVQNQIQYASTPNTSVITGEEVSKKQTNNNVELIKQFVNLCNEKKQEEAYNLLTEDCKENVFLTIENFKKDYCNTIFASKKTYDLELWLSKGGAYTYKITYYNDNLLQTGKLDNDNNFEDYITVLQQEEGLRININGFIYEKEINKTVKQNDIEIIVKSKSIYKEYETYNINIKNYGTETMCLSKTKDSEDICIYDEKDVKYKSYIHEIPDDILTLKPKYQKNISIKFGKIYSNTKEIEKIEFNQIQTNINNTNTISISVVI